MEVTCNRCHQGIPADSCYCPTCGLPQLVYSSEDGSGPVQADLWTGALHDAGTVEWKPALRVAMLLAVPAGLLSCGQSPVALLSLFWMAAAAAWAVTLYARKQKPAWVTMGAGARIGLVTGLLAGWFAFAASGAALFVMRFVFGKGKEFDEPWQALVAQMAQQWQQMSPDAQTAASLKSLAGWLLSAEGRAGSVLGGLMLLEFALLLFATAGGAIGARLMARSRRPEA
jgi:hypothetical protein